MQTFRLIFRYSLNYVTPGILRCTSILIKLHSLELHKYYFINQNKKVSLEYWQDSGLLGCIWTPTYLMNLLLASSTLKCACKGNSNDRIKAGSLSRPCRLGINPSLGFDQIVSYKKINFASCLGRKRSEVYRCANCAARTVSAGTYFLIQRLQTGFVLRFCCPQSRQDALHCVHECPHLSHQSFICWVPAPVLS
jgi:hypothetical protein